MNMANEQENAQIKRYPRFARSAMTLCPAKNFGEYLFWSYANLQMLCAALRFHLTIRNQKFICN